MTTTPYVEMDHGHATPCWIWQGPRLARDGYGVTRGADGRTTTAHRVVYEGRRLSPETRKRLSEAAKRSWAARKERQA